MDNQELRERINKAVQRSREISGEIEALLTSGKAMTDPVIAEKMVQRERALDDASASKRELDAVKRESELDAWRQQPASGAKAPVGFVAQPDPNDPTATPEYREAFRRYSKRLVDPGGFTERERNTLTVASDGAGGYTVPADSRSNILRRLPGISKIGGLVTTQPTSRDLLEWPRVTPNADASAAVTSLEHIYTSAFVGSMVGEQPATTAGQNEPSFGMFAIPIKNARSQARLSFNLVADAEFDILSFLESDGALNMGLLREAQIVNGNGIGPNVKGILAQAGDGTGGTIRQVDVTGTTVHTISNTTANLGSATKLLDLVYACPAQYRVLPDFGIAMNSATEKAIRQLVDGFGRFIWAAGFEGKPDTLLGYQTILSEFLPTAAAANDTPIIVGAFGQAIVGVRQDLSVAVYQERFADVDQVAIFLRQRFGVGVANNDAFRIASVT